MFDVTRVQVLKAGKKDAGPGGNLVSMNKIKPKQKIKWEHRRTFSPL